MLPTISVLFVDLITVPAAVGYELRRRRVR